MVATQPEKLPKEKSKTISAALPRPRTRLQEPPLKVYLEHCSTTIEHTNSSHQRYICRFATPPTTTPTAAIKGISAGLQHHHQQHQQQPSKVYLHVSNTTINNTNSSHQSYICRFSLPQSTTPKAHLQSIPAVSLHHPQPAQQKQPVHNLNCTLNLLVKSQDAAYIVQ